MKNASIAWPGGRHKLVTFSYDDGTVSDRRLVQVFNENHLKGTFHINAGLFERPDRLPPSEVNALYRGHEVAGHTWTHPTIARLPLDQVALQVLEDRRGLESLVGYPVNGFSYPNGSLSDGIVALLPGLGIRYARKVGGTGSFELPDDPYRWVSTCHHNNGLLERTNEFLAHAKSQYLIWFSVWGHSYEFDRDQNWSLIEDVCRQLGGRDDVWSATCLEAFDYLEAARRVRFGVDLTFALNPASHDVWFTLDGKVICLKPGMNRLD